MLIPFQTIDWNKIPATEYKGESGTSFWRVLEFPGLRLRMIEYSPGYLADHWCSKGHIIFCTEGEMDTELEDGRIFKLSKGMCYFVGDKCEAHRSSTENGCKLFVVD